MDIENKQIENILYYIQLYTDCSEYQKLRILQVLLTEWKPVEIIKTVEVEKVIEVPLNIDAFISNFCDLNGCAKSCFTGKISRFKSDQRIIDVTNLRAKFVKEAIDFGYNIKEIADKIKLHKTIVYNYLNR